MQPNPTLARRTGVRTLRHLLAVVLTAVAATLGLVVSTAGPAAACSCVGGGIPQYAEWADAVFTGELASAPDRSEEQTVTYTFDVEQIYAGKVPELAEVRTPSQESACGLAHVESGRRFVIFASYDDGALSTGLCSGSQVANAAYTDRLERHLGIGTIPSREHAPRAPSGVADDPGRDDGGRTWMLVVPIASGVVILAALGVGAARLHRQA